MGVMKHISAFVDEFEQGYISCLLWTDESQAQEDVSEAGENWEDFDWSEDMIDPESKDEIREVCEDFVTSNWDDLELYVQKGRPADHAGHDFALSRNGHGTGFWDRGIEALGDRLHEAAKVYGYAALTLSHSKAIYYQG
jgi:hypothetical protein